MGLQGILLNKVDSHSIVAQSYMASIFTQLLVIYLENLASQGFPAFLRAGKTLFLASLSMQSSFLNDTGGADIKINIRHIIITIVLLFFLGLVFYFFDSFTGNPVSAFSASRKIRDYAAVTYSTLDLELSKVKFNFKNGAYGCYAQSKKSEDTKFYIRYSHGRVSDDYEYEVANHFTTYRRLSRDFNDKVTNILEKEYSHETSLIVGDLVGDTRQLTPDAPLNLNNMPLQLSLTVNILSDVRNEEQMAALLLELHQLLLSKDIAIDRYTLRLEEPLPEKSKPGSGNNLYLQDFPAENITDDKESLISAIREHNSFS